jgi:osmoprotectant transport system permease protein
MFHFLHRVVDWYGGNWSGSNGVLWSTWDTVRIAGEAILITLAVTLPIALFLGHKGRGGFLAINVTNVGRALPAIAVLVIAEQIWGIGAPPALATLVVLSIPPIMTATYNGIRQVDPDVVDAARGMGMRGRQVLWRVELPSAVPLIAGGIRTATVQAVAIVPLTAYIAYTSLGSIIVTGISTGDHVEIFAGALVLVVLALATDLVLAGVQRLVTPRGVLVAMRQPVSA